VCLVPVVARDAAAAQIVLMAAGFLAFATVQLHLQPWRSTSSNILDGVLASLMVLLLTCCAMSTTFPDADAVIGRVGLTIFILIFLSTAGTICFHLYKRFRPTPLFPRFICHHKADAAAQARYLQMVFVTQTGESCFLDSDNLNNLDDLLDVVRCRTGQLIVLLTGDTLHRPWCAAEIATAHATHQKAVALMTSSFVEPNSDEIEPDTIEKYLHVSDVKLVELGITNLAISRAFTWLLSDSMQAVKMDPLLSGLSRFRQAVRDSVEAGRVPRLSPSVVVTRLSMKKLPQSMGMSVKSTQVLQPGMLVISSLPGSDEATAAAGILAAKLRGQVMEFVKPGICVLADVEAQDDEVMEAVSKAHAVLVVLSLGSLRSPQQLQVILHTQKAAGAVEVVPILTSSFRFPDRTFYEQELRPVYAHAAALSEALRCFFKHIAVGLATDASDHVLDAQCRDVAGRIPKDKANSSVISLSSILPVNSLLKVKKIVTFCTTSESQDPQPVGIGRRQQVEHERRADDSDEAFN